VIENSAMKITNPRMFSGRFVVDPELTEESRIVTSLDGVPRPNDPYATPVPS